MNSVLVLVSRGGRDGNGGAGRRSDYDQGCSLERGAEESAGGVAAVSLAAEDAAEGVGRSVAVVVHLLMCDERCGISGPTYNNL